MTEEEKKKFPHIHTEQLVAHATMTTHMMLVSFAEEQIALVDCFPRVSVDSTRSLTQPVSPPFRLVPRAK